MNNRLLKLLAFSIPILAGLFITLYYCLISWKPLPPPPPGLLPKAEAAKPLLEPLTRNGVIALTNKARQENGGLPPLQESQPLNRIAEARVKDMFDRQYIGHLSPVGEGATDVAHRIGYAYRILSENLASGVFLNNQKLVESWMQSPGHKKNILLDSISEIGVAVDKGMVQGREAWIAVQIFGQQSPSPAGEAGKTEVRGNTPLEKDMPSTCVKPDQSLHDSIEADKKELAQLMSRATSLRGEIDSIGRELDAQRGVRQAQTRLNPPDLRSLTEAHNNQVGEYNRLIGNITDRQRNLDASVARYNKEVDRYNRCREQ